MKKKDVIVLGAGVTGLACALELGNNCCVIEKDNSPGGHVKTYQFNDGFWFDHVLHILHFKDEVIQQKVTALLKDVLTPCPPVAWIETTKGITLYPFQLNLGGLEKETAVKCINDFAKNYFGDQQKDCGNYKEFLSCIFGESMCNLFYYPYNEKQYKYPLEQISAESILWNIHRPSFNDILNGIIEPNVIRQTYNSNAFYPIPPPNAPQRGMELLSIAMAKKVSELDLNTEVLEIDEHQQVIITRHFDYVKEYKFADKCFSTIPLPKLIQKCRHAPQLLKNQVQKLEFTKVFSIGLCIKGPRPHKPGHWRYYADSSIAFTRLIFMTEFDPYAAPDDGWSLLVETTHNYKEKLNEDEFVNNVIAQLKELGVINNDKHSIIASHYWYANPAYVVFTHKTKQIIENCFTYLKQYNITSSGRYGKWEYSSMYQNIRDGFAWAKEFITSSSIV